MHGDMCKSHLMHLSEDAGGIPWHEQLLREQDRGEETVGRPAVSREGEASSENGVED